MYLNKYLYKEYIFSVTDWNDVEYIHKKKREINKRSTPTEIDKEINKRLDFGITDKYQKQVVRDIHITNIQNDIISDTLFIKYITRKRIESPIFKLNNIAVVIDNFSKIIYYINKSGKIIDYKKFKSSFDKYKIAFVKQNINGDEIYYFIKTKNSTIVYLFDLSDLKFIKIASLPKYIEKPIIKGNYIYYIVYDKNKQTRTLLKLCINI